MEALLTQLPEPHSIWQQFHAISQIPRGSHNTEHIADWLVNFGREHGCEAQKDAAGNVVIRVPASAGKEDKPIVCLQGHMDMVCEKATDSAHNFATDPIQWRIVGEHLMANNTTLGADNGIGVAAAMVFVVDRSLVHGPLELLFTADEEVGLIGAAGLGTGVLKAQYLINCDSEEEHAICVGCAGGFVSKAKIPLTRLEAVPANMTLMHVHLTGLRGGHSGVDIHKEFGNGIKLLVRMLKHAQQQEFLLSSIKGGSAHNAIPREVHAMVYVPTPRVAEFTESLQRIAGAIGKEYATVEPHMVLNVTPTDSAEQMAPCDRLSTVRAINFLNTIPSGVLRSRAGGLPSPLTVVPPSATTSTAPCRFAQAVRHLRPFLPVEAASAHVLQLGPFLCELAGGTRAPRSATAARC
ncbi:aminoacyl-histidine dipeptidase [Paratrimastix pyriformis]|uniref:Aminoacyl-histidine dipeptidase n=1 Tax=Paratrimastix pyriformis TaxID=342808 RepID=A0ABQ8UAY5_9EUKA|nr:aminoacyl-histidine dipeptidase [Paratrimastix pyriformis]